MTDARDTDASDVEAPPRRAGYSRFLFRAPSVTVSLGLVVLLNLALGAIVIVPASSLGLAVLEIVAVFVIPAIVAALGTVPASRALGGRLGLRRSVLLALSAGALVVPLAALGRGLAWAIPTVDLPTIWLILFLQGPILWMRHLSLFGIANPSHARSLPASLLQPALTILAAFAFTGPTLPLVTGALAFLVLGFACCALLLRAADRPLRREFGISGVSLIRPLLDHINEREPSATDTLERFFARFAIPADLRVSLLHLRSASGPVATIVLPTVHPGPFAALGASDLPRKIATRLGPRAGVVLVPHTPCNHDLDLPTTGEATKVADAAEALLTSMRPDAVGPVGPLVSPHDGSFARAQLLGGTAIVLVTQAPAPTDDIAFPVADRIYRSYRGRPGPEVAIIDAHNSYVEDEGDLFYGTPKAEKLVADVDAAVAAAVRAARPGPLEAGAAAKIGYTSRSHGIGPEGIRALVLRTHGTTSAYVLIDGNNLLRGIRPRILDALAPLVTTSEVMTTDNHVVHEVDGGINPVGERYPANALAEDAVAVVREAIGRLAPVTLGAGTSEVRGVNVLGPAWTERLLTSLGDTMSMFANGFAATFLLLLSTSLIVLFIAL
ncbi:MAG: DUF2070 family protein [Thermoplasmata archaeon]